MVQLLRPAVLVLLLLVTLRAILDLLSSTVTALGIAGSGTSAAVALGLLPLATWMAWRTAVSSPLFSRWLVRGTIALAGTSVVLSVVGLSWPLLVAVVTGVAFVDVPRQTTLSELGGTGICVSAVLFGVIAARALWDQPPRSG